MKRPFALAWCATLIASSAAAQTAPQWAKAPTVADVAAAYPAKARATGLGGEVLLSCRLGPSLTLQACVALRETPKGQDFAAAARELAGLLQAAPAPGREPGADIQAPVSFSPDMLTGAPVITRPRWAALPSAQDFQATFPKTENGVNSVRVVLSCLAQGGALSDCTVETEEPAGQGYGQGALALAAKFRVEPWSLDGKPTVGARIRLPIRYELTPANR